MKEGRPSTSMTVTRNGTTLYKIVEEKVVVPYKSR